MQEENFNGKVYARMTIRIYDRTKRERIEAIIRKSGRSGNDIINSLIDIALPHLEAKYEGFIDPGVNKQSAIIDDKTKSLIEGCVSTFLEGIKKTDKDHKQIKSVLNCVYNILLADLAKEPIDPRLIELGAYDTDPRRFSKE